MTIYEQLIELCKGREGEIFGAAEIKSMLKKQFGANPASVLPSDYCYNLWNKGTGCKKPLFVKIDSGAYKYLGPNAPYTGDIEWRPKGVDQGRKVGEWIEGKCRFFGPNQEPEKSEPENEPPLEPVTIAEPRPFEPSRNENPWKNELNEIWAYSKELDGDILDELKRLSNAVYGEHILSDSRRVLEVIVTVICDKESNRKRGTEPLRGIIDRLYKDTLIPSNIHTAMSVVIAIGNFGAHPKPFHPRQVRSALNELSIIIEWFIEYKKTWATNIPT